ncbi:hypothetical protein ACWF9G_19665 [Nocardia sp. NPDC055029]
MAITAPVTCWACTTAPSTTVFPEYDLGPWAPLFACQPCLDDYRIGEELMREYH